jgi:hypothetical protein
MPTSAVYSISLNAGGVSISKSITREGTPINLEETLPIATAGTLSTRTDNDTGIVTVASHSITASDQVAVFWSGGRRYDVDVTAVTATTISIDIGSGDNLPIATTAVTIVAMTTINILIDGDNTKVIGLSLETSDTTLTTKGLLLFEDATGDDIAVSDLTANAPIVYDITGGSSNPFTGDVIVSCRAANANSSYAATLKLVGSYDATP